MSIGSFLIALFLIQYLRSVAQAGGHLPEWKQKITWIRFVAIGLLSAQAIWQDSGVIGQLLNWLWYVLILVLVVYPYRLPEFRGARSVLLSVLPYLLLILIMDVVEAVAPTFYKSIDDFLELGAFFAAILIFVMWLGFRKQQKALDAERLKREQEEQTNRIITAQNSQLEQLVAERTAEITRQKEELQTALTELQLTQQQLVQREKLASLGELTAGIAHEIQNPLNFVNNFADVSVELVDELRGEREKPQGERDEELVADILADLEQNTRKISEHGKRAASIVRGMLQHSRTSTGQKQPTDLNALCDEYMRLSYHGLRAKDKTFNASFVTTFTPDLPTVDVVPEDFGRVLLNLFNNAFYAVQQKQKDGSNQPYQPTVTASTSHPDGTVEIRISDNGTGIPDAVRQKIFQPFFTTKPTGHGTGLGLSLSYDIITKGHGGTIDIESQEGQGTTFIIRIPVRTTS